MRSEEHRIETLYTCALSATLKDLTAKTALDELRRLAHEVNARAVAAERRVELLILGWSDLVCKTAVGYETPEQRRAAFKVLEGRKHDLKT